MSGRNSRFIGKRSLALAGWAAALCSTVPSPAMAQAWKIEPFVSDTQTWTNNSAFGGNTNRQSDFVLELTPGLRVSGASQGLRAHGEVSVVGVVYADATRPNQVLPRADIGANLTLADHLAYLDTGLISRQSAADPFGVRPDNTSSINSYTTTQYRVSPYIDRDVSPNLHLQVRSDNTWTHTNSALFNLTDGYFGRHAASLNLRPTPVGAGVDVERTASRFSDQTTEGPVHDIARAHIGVALDPQTEVSAIGGHERLNVDLGGKEKANIYGARLVWHPTERTNINGRVEHRFFGTVWDLSFTHRTPFLAFDTQFTRQASTFNERLMNLPAGADIAALLDASLTTRFPDPTDRAKAVHDYLLQSGLSPTLAGALNLQSDRVDLYNSATGTVTFLSPRNNVALSIYRSSTQDILNPQDSVQSVLTLPVDSVEHGLRANWSHRLTPTAALLATALYSRTKSLSSTNQATAQQTTYRIEIRQILSPKTQAFFGVRRQFFRSSLAAEDNEAGLFFGLAYQF